MKIAVIGAGIFGSVISHFLSKQNHDVTLFERQGNILSGASANNQNRLHLGFHYPRDLETAIQSKIGFEEFKSNFYNACVFDFSCYYGLSISDSKTDIRSYLEFIEKAGLECQFIHKEAISEFGFDVSKISHLLLCDEGVVDNDLLRKILVQNIDKHGVKLSLSDSVVSISKRSSGWEVKSNKRNQIYDVVIKSTYGLDSILLTNFEYVKPTSIYQATIVLEVKLPFSKFGITVVDGDFITILPKGSTNNFLLYSPKPSVMKQSLDLNEVLDVVNSRSHIEDSTKKLISVFERYFLNFKKANIVNKYITIRNIDFLSTSTDKRVSKINKIAENFYDISSGKIDHSITVANQLVNMLK